MGHPAQIPLKARRPAADSRGVRLSRLVIEANQNRVSLTLHPKLTVVAGVPGRVVRELTDADRASFASTAARYVARAAVHRAAHWSGFPGDPG